MRRPCRGAAVRQDGGLSGTPTFLGDCLLILMGHLIILGWLYQDPLISKLLSLPLSCVCSALGLSLGGGSPAALPAAPSPHSEGSVAGSLCPSSMLLVRVAGGASCVPGLGVLVWLGARPLRRIRTLLNALGQAVKCVSRKVLEGRDYRVGPSGSPDLGSLSDLGPTGLPTRGSRFVVGAGSFL